MNESMSFILRFENPIHHINQSHKTKRERNSANRLVITNQDNITANEQ
jgi:hypothetical protein